MKFALIGGKRFEATKGSKGLCPACGAEMFARCGDVKIHHWAHKGGNHCDQWWENESDWHRSWKNLFPIAWQEIIHRDKNGEKHIADIKTPDEWVIEFQHSFLKPEERRARTVFYGKLIWVVDGTRRKNDIPQFFKTLNMVRPFGGKANIRRVPSTECRLLQEWEDCHTPVFFDFGGDQLWWLLDSPSKGLVYVAPFSRVVLIHLHRDGEQQNIQLFDQFVSDIGKLCTENEVIQRRVRR
jgi:competence protein CoiA